MPPDRVTLSSATPFSVSVCPAATASVPFWSVANWMVLSVLTVEVALSRSSVPPAIVAPLSVTASYVVRVVPALLKLPARVTLSSVTVSKVSV